MEVYALDISQIEFTSFIIFFIDKFMKVCEDVYAFQ